MTLQEMFDISVGGVINQNGPSANETPNGLLVCLYRGPNGTKCAVGHLIPDDKYDPKMEGHTLNGLISIWPRALPEEIPNSLELMRLLQSAHDCAVSAGSKFMREFKDDAYAVAQTFGLQWKFG